MATASTLTECSGLKNENFKCGVIEGFYGRPWTTEQRKDLFLKLKKWGMNAYVYAPKDDYKHRAYWRELYTVEEAEHLTSLIAAAKDQNITFYYAISPGLDITYSSVKEVTALKRKLEQVSQFGCNAFALLFDDIEPEMSEVDKEVFQSFAHAQVSVTNEMYQHLGQPVFIICPTQYCAARATPNVSSSEYLNTLGAKLPPEVDILWTGPKVISRTLTLESIEEITEVLRRPPVIWDNLHANDYDQKRVFLGPYSGRSPDLIPKLRGVLTNPNCEYGANFIAIHTLAQWSRCNVDAIRDTSLNDPVSADIKLETEGGSEDGPCGLSPNMYHPRRALKNAIEEWLIEFNKNKPAWGPIAKPQQLISTPVPIPIIIPSVNTCMSVTSSTSTATTSSATCGTPCTVTNTASTSATLPLPCANGSQLHALAEVCCTVSTSVMNSLASETKVIPLEVKKTCKLSSIEPMECNSTPGDSPAHSCTRVSEDTMLDSPNNTIKCISCTMQVEASSDDTLSSSTTHMLVDSGNTSLLEDTPDCSDSFRSGKELTYQDLSLLCDLFYLPFEHGGLAIHLLQEFNWLKINANVLSDQKSALEFAPEIEEWHRRAATFNEMSQSVNILLERLTCAANRELLYELYPYIWDVQGIISLLNSYAKWLGTGSFTSQIASYTQGQYTWFSKGWKEAFMSGDQEPWVFRGGLTADLQRLLPVDSGMDLFMYRPPEIPSSKINIIRPYNKDTDREKVFGLCALSEGCTNMSTFPELPGDCRIGRFLDMCPELCMVVEENNELVAYISAVLDARHFYDKLDAYFSTLAGKYPVTAEDLNEKQQEFLDEIHNFTPSKYLVPEQVRFQHPSQLTCFVSPKVSDESVGKRLLACQLAALRANGSFGVHTFLSKADRPSLDWYSKLGFVEIQVKDEPSSMVYIGRSF